MEAYTVCGDMLSATSVDLMAKPLPNALQPHFILLDTPLMNNLRSTIQSGTKKDCMKDCVANVESGIYFI